MNRAILASDVSICLYSMHIVVSIRLDNLGALGTRVSVQLTKYVGVAMLQKSFPSTYMYKMMSHISINLLNQGQ